MKTKSTFSLFIIFLLTFVLSVLVHAQEQEGAPVEPWQYNNGVQKADALAIQCAAKVAYLASKLADTTADPLGLNVIGDDIINTRKLAAAQCLAVSRLLFDMDSKIQNDSFNMNGSMIEPAP